MVAHVLLQLRQAFEVDDLAVRRLVPHAAVPAIEAAHDADDAAAAVAGQRLGRVVDVVGDEMRALVRTARGAVGRPHADVAAVAEGHAHGGVELCGVEIPAKVAQGGLRVWVEAVWCYMRLG